MCSREPAQYGKLIMLVLQGTMHVPVILATQETKEGGSQVQGHLGQHSKITFQKYKRKNNPNACKTPKNRYHLYFADEENKDHTS
jgi:hypothetical protein